MTRTKIPSRSTGRDSRQVTSIGVIASCAWLPPGGRPTRMRGHGPRRYMIARPDRSMRSYSSKTWRATACTCTWAPRSRGSRWICRVVWIAKRERWDELQDLPGPTGGWMNVMAVACSRSGKQYASIWGAASERRAALVPEQNKCWRMHAPIRQATGWRSGYAAAAST